MNKKQSLIIFCLFFLFGCDFLDTIRREHTDWESLMSVPENEKGWFPPLFDGSLSLQEKVFDVVIINDPSTLNVWGRFSYSDDLFVNFPVEVNYFMNNYIMLDIHRRRLRRIGFNESKIDLYFTQNQTIDGVWRDRIWYYFININERRIYFFNFFLDQINECKPIDIENKEMI